MVLAKGAWHAFPLTVAAPGSPYRLRVKTPSDTAQQLVVSVQEASQANGGSALRMDSAMIVEPTTATREPFVAHELLFWPKSESAYVLVYNSDATHPAAIAEIVLEEMDSTAQASVTGDDIHGPDSTGRVCSLYMDKPLLPENFNAQRQLEPGGVRELDSWQTAWQASQRLAEYTRYSGFNAATLTVACQGGAIYPSKLLNPSPKFDSGVFLSDGSTPELKDSVELICRQFDARGLKLFLAIDGEGALPELERITARIQPQENSNTKKADNKKTEDKQSEDKQSEDKQSDEGTEQVPSTDEAQANLSHYQINTEGRIAMRRNPISDGGSANEKSPLLYNPLDARVQMTLEKVVRELVERYGHHPCFAGVQINLSPRSHFNFAGDLWGYDEATITRFQQTLGAALPTSSEQRLRLLTTTLRLNYLNYRAEELTRFYARLGEIIRRESTHARLILNPAKLEAVPPEGDKFAGAANSHLQPSDMLRACGIDCERLLRTQNVSLLRPQTDSPLRSPRRARGRTRSRATRSWIT